MNWILWALAIGCVSSSSSWAASIRTHHEQANDEGRTSVLHIRQRREAHNVIEDCMTVTSKDGHFYYKASPKDASVGVTCGLFLITDPERQIEIDMLHMDVSCEEGGLISVVDGWELNGEFFPSPEDHELPLSQRVVSECGSRQVKNRYLSSQNAALVQYRVPAPGQGFSLHVRYVKNPKPCNILVEGTSDIYTLSNHGRRVNCSVTTLFPASTSLVSVDIGSSGRSLLSHSRHGIVHKCEEKGMEDYLQIGGSSGLDSANLMVADSICGLDRDSKSSEVTVYCGITTVRLVSSGRNHNVAQIAIRPAEEEELFSPSVMCPA